MKWIRLWTAETLNGTTFTELNAEQRGVWFSLLALAGYSSIPGLICISKSIPYTQEQIAKLLNLQPQILADSIAHLASKSVNKIRINSDGTIAITNWKRYQTEYDRQKGYRKRLQQKVTGTSYDTEVRSKKLEVRKELKDLTTLSRNRDVAVLVLEFLNKKTGRNYRLVDANLNLIQDRLKSGVTQAQCFQVIAKKVRDWSNDPRMRSYLRPATLFNKTKFEQYVGELLRIDDEPGKDATEFIGGIANAMPRM